MLKTYRSSNETNQCLRCKKYISKDQICVDHCNKPYCVDTCLRFHAMSYLLFEKKVSSIKTDEKSDELELSKNKISDILNIDKGSHHPLTTKGQFRSHLENTEFYTFEHFEFMKIGTKRQSLGCGAFGDVFLAKHKEENKKYAIKVMSKEQLKLNQVTTSFIKREIDIHSKLDHPYIIALKNFHEDEDDFYMFLDYAKNGTLYSKLRKMKNGFSEETAFKYFIQTCSAIYFLHSNSLAHRDLKPENLLLDESNNIKLADFGWCDYYNADSKFYDICGTYEYMAPEIVNEVPYTQLVDIWALGVLLYELLHGKSPFFVEGLYDDNKNTDKLFKKILNLDYQIGNNISLNCKSLIQCKFFIKHYLK